MRQQIMQKHTSVSYTHLKDAFKGEELRGYLFIVFAAIVLITLNTWGMFPDLKTAVHHVAFQVAVSYTHLPVPCR